MNKLKYIVPNLITGLALFCGLYSIRLSLEQDFMNAAWFILYAVLMDKLDGTAAGLLKAQSRFGNHFDSVSDAVSFGFAVGILAYYLAASIIPDYRIILLTITAIFIVASVWRLITFTRYSSKVKDFIGTPTTLSAGLIGTYVLLTLKYNLPNNYLLMLPLMLMILSMLMNGKFEFPKVRKRESKNFNIFQYSVIALVYILVILKVLPEILFMVAFLYMALGLMKSKKIPL